MKLVPTMTIRPSTPDWFLEVKFDYHQELKDAIKSWPGSKWKPEIKAWLVPTEMQPVLIETALEFGFEVKGGTT